MSTRAPMPRAGVLFLGLAISLGWISACDQFSPTTVDNPNITDADFLGTPDAARTWVRGVERTFMQTLNTLVVNGELASDNYFNNYTTNSKVFDIPRIEYHDPDVRSLQADVARLREAANFGLESVLPADETSSEREEAELLFYRGLASLFAGEYFVALPVANGGEVAPPETHLQLAVADFESARSLVSDPELTTGYTLALARTHHRLSDRDRAAAEAEAALAADPAFLRTADYDGVSGPTNSMQTLLTNATNNFQPLPRLDFLDPKFYVRGPEIESPLPVLKAEEAHLILAEALLAAGDIAGAKARLVDLLGLVVQRPVDAVDSRNQLRGRAGGHTEYPNRADVRVAASPGAPLRHGLVLTREGPPVPVPVVSGTSVDHEQIAAIASVEEGLYVLYLMRQEIFIAEGRRTVDLGIRFPVALREVQSNPLAEDGSWYTEAQVPPFIPRDFGMDSFDYDQDAGTVIIHHDLNRALVENRSSAVVLPFHE